MLTFRKCSNLFASLVIAALLALAVAGAAPAIQKPVSALTPTWYVKPTGNDANTCKTPALACKTIQAAIGKATTGGTIKVAVGVYTVTTGTQVVLINKSLTLLGGYNNAFTLQTGRATIDGKNLRRAVRITAGLTVTMDRFTIQNGHASPGGGINNAANLAITNSTITKNFGGGISSSGPLSIATSTISYNTIGGGVQAGGTASITNSTLDHNTPQGLRYTGSGLLVASSTIRNSTGRGVVNTGTATLVNSTVSGTLGNTTFTDGSGVESTGTLTLTSSTVTKNFTGVRMDGGTTTLSNTIVAGNSSDAGVTPNDCAGTLTTGGFNLIGSADACTFTPTTGDQVGSNLSPLDAKLSALQDHGGLTFTHALLSDSPAIDMGNPGTCSPIDQRGFIRPTACDIGAYEYFTLGVYSSTRMNVDNTSAGTVRFAVTFNELVTGVDVSDFVVTPTGTVTGASVTGVTGAGETYTVTVNTGTGDGTLRLDLIDNDSILGFYNDDPLGGVGLGNGDFTSGDAYTIVNPSVVSVNRATAQFTSAATVNFTVTFSTAVTGVNLLAPFSDFHVTTDGLTGAKVTAVTGSGKTYSVTVNHGLGSGTLRLDVADDDTIKDPTSNRKLGGTGLANGDFTAGLPYDIVPMPQAPGATIWDTTPSFKWTRLAGVTQYQFQLLDGITPVYTKLVPSTACTTTTCTSTPTTLLTPKNTYNWSVQAYSGGLWRDFSPSKAFTLKAPLAGYWDNYSSWISFYVAPNRVQVLKFTYYITSCGKNISITRTAAVPIVNGKFSFTGSAYANGTFNTSVLEPTTASGRAGFNSFYLNSCGYAISGSLPWNNYWMNSTQPAIGATQPGLNLFVLQMPDAPFRLFVPFIMQR